MEVCVLVEQKERKKVQAQNNCNIVNLLTNEARTTKQ